MKLLTPTTLLLTLISPSISHPSPPHHRYPTPSRIASLFAPWTHPGNLEFMENLLADNATWDFRGTFTGSGIYSKTGFIEFHRSLKPIFGDLLNVLVDRVIGGGESPWAEVEVHIRNGTRAKNGRLYNQRASLVVRFDEEESIVEAHEYLDSELTQLVFDENLQ